MTGQDEGTERDVRYVSTRGQAPVLGFEEVLLAGLARDGGLYVPETWPAFSEQAIAAMAGKSYADIALEVMAPFVGDALPPERFAAIVGETYAAFDHAAVAPLAQMASNDWLLELFHGPTFAFKDYALQLLGRLFDDVLARRGLNVTVVGATSGDTGSAAIEACRGRDAIDVFILHPEGRVSEVQRRQMTTVEDRNVHNIAIQGTFDDCQDLVKAMFGDQAFRDRLALSAVNSINWVRVMAQIVYYFTSAVALGAPRRAVAFSVPTGNFGDVFAGYAAGRMGLPIERLVVATNRNDILARFFTGGEYRKGEVAPTMSPSMDIQVSSNFERLVFDMLGRDGGKVAQLMAEFADTGAFRVTDDRLAWARALFAAAAVDEEATARALREALSATGRVVDPHTAVGLRAAALCRGSGEIAAHVPVVCLSTAHAAKFPEAVERAAGVRPAAPPRLAALFDKPERYDVLPNDLAAVQRYISDRARALAA